MGTSRGAGREGLPREREGEKRAGEARGCASVAALVSTVQVPSGHARVLVWAAQCLRTVTAQCLQLSVCASAPHCAVSPPSATRGCSVLRVCACIRERAMPSVPRSVTAPHSPVSALSVCTHLDASRACKAADLHRAPLHPLPCLLEEGTHNLRQATRQAARGARGEQRGEGGRAGGIRRESSGEERALCARGVCT
jgi:hypothetical protein